MKQIQLYHFDIVMTIHNQQLYSDRQVCLLLSGKW